MFPSFTTENRKLKGFLMFPVVCRKRTLPKIGCVHRKEKSKFLYLHDFYLSVLLPIHQTSIFNVRNYQKIF